MQLVFEYSAAQLFHTRTPILLEFKISQWAMRNSAYNMQLYYVHYPIISFERWLHANDSLEINLREPTRNRVKDKKERVKVLVYQISVWWSLKYFIRNL